MRLALCADLCAYIGEKDSHSRLLDGAAALRGHAVEQSGWGENWHRLLLLQVKKDLFARKYRTWKLNGKSADL